MTRPPMPAWTDPDLAGLLASDPELVAIADALQATRVLVPPGRRRARGTRLAVAGAVAAVAVATALVAPWSPRGQAAILQRIGSALTPPPGSTVYERDVIRQADVTGGPRLTIVRDSWTGSTPTVVLGVGGARPDGRGGVVRDPVGELRRALAGGDAAIAGRITFDGRSVYRITATAAGASWVAYVDAATLRPVRFVLRGTARSPAAVVTVTDFRYLPPTIATSHGGKRGG